MNNTIIIYLILLMIISSKGYSQKKFTIPMKAGDVEVFASKSKVDSTRPSIGIRAIINNNSHRNTYLNCILPYHPIAPISYPGIMTSTINISGMFREEDINYQDPHNWDAYPAFIPLTDSIKMGRSGLMWGDSTMFYITRRFDTTIFNKNVNAYESINENRRFIIADSFGFVNGDYGSKESKIKLSSAIIDGVKYNWDERTWRMMPLCIGNTYQYLSKNDEYPPVQSIITMRIDRDTMINGQQYFVFTKNEQFGSMKLLKESYKGIEVYGSADLYFPSNAVPGRFCSNGMITDTMCVLFDGKIRRQVILDYKSSTESYYKSMWIEEIGLVYDWFSGYESRYTDSLIFASVCGMHYGTQVNVNENSIAPQKLSLFQNSPNPFSTSTNIHYAVSHSSNVHLEVFDLLGRKIATLVNEQKDAGEYTSLFDIRNSLFDIHPGVYFYQLKVGNNVMTKKMIIIN